VRNRLRALNFQHPSRVADEDEAPARPAARRRAKASAADVHRGAPSTIREVLEIVSETLWFCLLFLVIGILSWKMPQISSTIDEISGNTHRVAAASDAPAQTQMQLRELERRLARYESKLAPLERGYALLKQRHSDLQKAYDALRSTTVRNAFSKPGELSATPAP